MERIFGTENIKALFKGAKMKDVSPLIKIETTRTISDLPQKKIELLWLLDFVQMNLMFMTIIIVKPLLHISGVLIPSVIGQIIGGL